MFLIFLFFISYHEHKVICIHSQNTKYFVFHRVGHIMLLNTGQIQSVTESVPLLTPSPSSLIIIPSVPSQKFALGFTFTTNPTSPGGVLNYYGRFIQDMRKIGTRIKPACHSLYILID